MKWCNILNMWVDEIEEEGYQFAGCHQECKYCDDCVEINIERSN